MPSTLPPEHSIANEHRTEPQLLALPSRWRWALRVAVVLLLVLAFWAYNTPQMVVMWDTFLQMCGLG